MPSAPMNRGSKHAAPGASQFAKISTPLFPRILRSRVMIKEVKTQANVWVGVDVLWKALAKDLKDILPKMMQNLVKDAHMYA
ncbi:hypothetical protein SADUNF_Sadunf11G0088500 [Salix dunnii]|uniref:Uncharacterized protein n=1 Tax=Salix dunnii TaxID=1413687 RepID=A0A835JQT0_9ROSI|nr:hypothetical protein SADUNF_Sadunf11G0088500 [Salix dunnii]